MKETKILMGMPITVQIADSDATDSAFLKVFDYFKYIDDTFSTYKVSSEISLINRGDITLEEASGDMQEVFALSKETKDLTHGYFDILTPQGKFDPSGLVKGWAVKRAALLLEEEGLSDFFVEAGGDVQARKPKHGNSLWSLGIRNPFDTREVVKVLRISNQGVATSGSYIRGQHIYNPHQPEKQLSDIVSLTVVGPNVFEADRFATAGFAMGREGINFIEARFGLEAYQIDKDGVALQTSGLWEYF